MDSTRYEVIESRMWFNRKTGTLASLYGACPWTNDADKPNWEIRSIGWTVRDNRTNTVGVWTRPV